MAQTPYFTTPLPLPNTVQVENFDRGGEAVAYHDTTSINIGDSLYRTSAVDVETISGGLGVGHITPGEWLEYTVSLATAGTFKLDVRAAAGDSGGGKFHLEVDGVNVTGAMGISDTGGWSTFATFSDPTVDLPAGTHVLRLAFDSATTKEIAVVDSMKFTRQASSEDVFSTDPITWKNFAWPSLAREEAQSFVWNNQMYVVGGYYNTFFQATRRVDLYNPANNTWVRKADAPSKITHAGVAIDAASSTVWFVGGYVGDFPAPPASATSWKYNPTTDTWTKGPSLPYAHGAGGAAIVGRKLYYYGGANTDRNMDLGEVYALNLDNQSAGWSLIGSMPNPRNHFGSAVVNGKIYVIGGQHLLEKESINQDEVDRFDPATNTWMKMASLPRPFSHFSASTVVYQNRYIVIVGGESPHDNGQPDVYAYDTVRNQWSAMTFLPAPRRAGVAAIIGNKLYQSGGYYRPEHQTVTSWVADLTDVFN